MKYNTIGGFRVSHGVKVLNNFRILLLHLDMQIRKLQANRQATCEGSVFRFCFPVTVIVAVTDHVHILKPIAMRQLLVNIDHVATLRNARGEKVPDPVEAARICEMAGAAGIVFHLREDRRHIRDEDVYALKKVVKGLFDFEMAATDEMIRICLDVHADVVTLVPESREELTTEGGLNMRKVEKDYRERAIPPFKEAGIEISLFVDPEPADLDICAGLGVEAVELHTGSYANAETPEVRRKELLRLRNAAEHAHRIGLKVNAGHGLNFGNIQLFLDEVPHLTDLSIGHALIADAVFNGLENTIRRMADIIAGRSTPAS